MSHSTQQQFSSSLIKQLLQTRIQNQLNRISSSKCLYVHSQIITMINFIFDFKFQSIINNKIYQFSDDPKAIDSDPSNDIIFFIYPKPSSMSTICSIILHNQSDYINKKYYVYFFPSKSYLCEEELKRMGVYEKVKIKKFDFNFIPFTQKLLSLQLPNHITSVQNQCCVAEALLKVEFMRGAFRNIYGKGKVTKSVLQLLQYKRKQINQITERQNDEDILIVLDRKADMVTPNLTGLSYECLLDFFFKINMNRIDVPGQIIGSNKKLQTFLLNNKKDPVYEQICYRNIKDVPMILKQKAQKLKQRIQIEKQKAKNYQDLNKLNNTLMVEYLLIQNHESLVLYILQKMKSVQFNNSLIIESSILQGQQAQNKFNFEDLQYLSLFYEIEHLLRLISLQSQTTDQSRYYLKNQKQIVDVLLNCQRIDVLPSLYNLVKGQVLRQSKFKNNWKQISQKFNLFPDQQDSYTDLNIIYSALSVKIVELILKNKFDPERSSLISRDTYFKGTIPKFKASNKVFVLILGGMSYNQISCFKAFEKHEKKNIVLLTTQIFGNNSLIKKFMFNPLA